MSKSKQTSNQLAPKAPPEFGGFRKEDRKRDRQSITTSTPGFEKLPTALLCERIFKILMIFDKFATSCN